MTDKAGTNSSEKFVLWKGVVRHKRKKLGDVRLESACPKEMFGIEVLDFDQRISVDVFGAKLLKPLTDDFILKDFAKEDKLITGSSVLQLAEIVEDENCKSNLWKKFVLHLHSNKSVSVTYGSGNMIMFLFSGASTPFIRASCTSFPMLVINKAYMLLWWNCQIQLGLARPTVEDYEQNTVDNPGKNIANSENSEKLQQPTRDNLAADYSQPLKDASKSPQLDHNLSSKCEQNGGPYRNPEEHIQADDDAQSLSHSKVSNWLTDNQPAGLQCSTQRSISRSPFHIKRSRSRSPFGSSTVVDTIHDVLTKDHDDRNGVANGANGSPPVRRGWVGKDSRRSPQGDAVPPDLKQKDRNYPEGEHYDDYHDNVHHRERHQYQSENHRYMSGFKRGRYNARRSYYNGTRGRSYHHFQERYPVEQDYHDDRYYYNSPERSRGPRHRGSYNSSDHSEHYESYRPKPGYIRYRDQNYNHSQEDMHRRAGPRYDDDERNNGSRNGYYTGAGRGYPTHRDASEDLALRMDEVLENLLRFGSCSLLELGQQYYDVVHSDFRFVESSSVQNADMQFLFHALGLTRTLAYTVRNTLRDVRINSFTLEIEEYDCDVGSLSHLKRSRAYIEKNTEQVLLHRDSCVLLEERHKRALQRVVEKGRKLHSILSNCIAYLHEGI